MTKHKQNSNRIKVHAVRDGIRNELCVDTTLGEVTLIGNVASARTLLCASGQR